MGRGCFEERTAPAPTHCWSNMAGVEAASCLRKDEDLDAPFMAPLKRALNHGGAQRTKRDRNESKRKQVQLATVDPTTGRPSVRTVVFRGFLPHTLTQGGRTCAIDQHALNKESCLLTFITDSRAAKVAHISGGADAVECCWWLDEAGVQFRIAGRAVLARLDSDNVELRAVAQHVWGRLSDSTRQTFTWPAPGADVTPNDGTVGTTGKGNTGSQHGEGGAVYFAVLLLVPSRVDELRLGGRQRRFIYECSGAGTGEGALSAPTRNTWCVRDVNP